MKDLLRFVLVANLIAIPPGYWAVNHWLQRCAYPIEMDVTGFAIGAIVIFIIAAIIVGLNASRVAMQNPVQPLRTE